MDVNTSATLHNFFDRLTTFTLKLAPKKAHIGVTVIKFLGHRVTAEGIAPDPGKVGALMKLPTPTNVSQLRSLLGGLRYNRKFLKGMAAATKYLNSLLKKGVELIFTPEHTKIVQALLEQLASPDVLAFPDFSAAIAGDRPFQLITDASVNGLGAVVEQELAEGTTRPICFLGRSTPPNEIYWSAT